MKSSYVIEPGGDVPALMLDVVHPADYDLTGVTWRCGGAVELLVHIRHKTTAAEGWVAGAALWPTIVTGIFCQRGARR